VSTWLAGALATLALVLARRPAPRMPLTRVSPARPDVEPADDVGWLLRGRGWWAAAAGVGAACFVSGRGAVAAGVAGALVAWWAIGRTEPSGVRRRREAEARDLPAVVHLLAAALETGADVSGAVRVVCGSLPGPASEVLGRVPPRLELGLHPEAAWRPVLERPGLAPLARVLVRAAHSGSRVGAEVDRLALDLHERSRAAVEERARTVGVRAAVPLGLCLLPSFVLLGVVPVAAALVRSLGL
jgi:Flp pilus assembly protein TadB